MFVSGDDSAGSRFPLPGRAPGVESSAAGVWVLDEHINTHELEQLRAEFEKIPKPKEVHELFGVALEAAMDTEAIKKIGLKLGWAERWWKRKKLAKAIECAAWGWLRPEARRPTTKQLDEIRRRVGLVDDDRGIVGARIVDQCREWAQRHPRLARHIAAQIAEAEFTSHPPSPIGDELVRGFAQFQSHLIVAALTRDAETARSIAVDALQGAAVVVQNVLRDSSAGACTFDANLMLPMGSLAKVAATPASEAARALWDGLIGTVHRYFVVVAGTGPHQYDGFWVPDVRPLGTPFPGAPRAYFYGQPHAVHLDDLPPFPCADEALVGRWRAYLRGGSKGGFEGTMFISVPVFGEGIAGGSGPKVVAIVNVNVRDGRAWPRAYSESWLDRAGKLASSWTTTAWHAYILAAELDRVRLGQPAGLLVSDSLAPAFSRLLAEVAAESILPESPVKGADENE